MEKIMTCDKNTQHIQKMFDEISKYYDKMNNIISLGFHYLIKFLSIRKLNLKPRSMILDLCCGTGDFTQIISKYYPRTRVIGLDISEGMLKLAKAKNPAGVFMKGDCVNLPFENSEFDYVTMGFGLRNIEDRKKALSEIYRVLDNGGKFLQLDFGRHNFISRVFDFIVPLFAKIMGTNENHYKYLINSKNEFPEPDDLIREFEDAGFKYVTKCDYLFGVISMEIMEKRF